MSTSLSLKNHRTGCFAVSAVGLIVLCLAMAFPGSGRGQPITEGFNNFDTGTRPAGWTFNGCNANSDTYTTAGNFGVASPSIKLDATGDYIQTAPLFRPDELSFWVKGQGTDSSSALLVEEYYVGAGWNEVTKVMPLPVAGTNLGPFEMAFLTTAARFSYTQSTGDLAFDDVDISLAPPSPTVTPSALPTATPTVTPVPTASPTPPTDIPNPSFELEPPLVGWTPVAGKPTYVARSNVTAYQGTYSCTFSATGYVSELYTDQGIRSGEANIIGGDQYDVGGWFYVAYEKGAITATWFKFNIEWLSDGTVVKTDSDSDWWLTDFNTWENREYRVTAPAAADQVRVYIAGKEISNNNNNIYIDVFYVVHTPAIIVTAPTLNESWYINTINNITWVSYQVTGNVDIHYNTDGGPWTPVVSNIADTGTYPWNVPNDPSPQARVRVQEAGGVGVSGQSSLFRIVNRNTINVLSPRGGEIWFRTGVYDIEWSYGPEVGPGAVDLHYSTNNGSSWILIASGVAIGSSPHPWTIPNVNSSACLVRVRQPASGTAGQSPAVFTIASPYFTVISPKGGEVWYSGDDHAITWTSTAGIIGNVNIDYSTTGAAGPWFQIAANQSNTGIYYPWSIPNVSTTTARVRVSEIGGIGLPGISAADFTLKGLTPPQPYVPLKWEVWMDVDTQGCGIYSIEAYDNDNIWIGCGCGLVYYWNGTVWELQADQGGDPMLGTNVKEFVALADDDVYGGGTGGYVIHYNGSYWETVYGPGKNVYSMDAADPDHVMAGCSSGWVNSYLSGEWTTTTVGESGTLYGCVYLKPDEAYAMRAGSDTATAAVFSSEDSGMSWSKFKEFGGWGLGGHPLGGCLDQYGRTRLWAAGDCGQIVHYNGSSWSMQTQSEYGINFQCVEVLDENNVWASGDGNIFHFNGSEWIIENNKLSTIYQFSAVDNRHVYAIGSTASTKIYRSWAKPAPTPYKPTPIGYKTPSPTPVPVNGPILGRVYDRVTGAGAGNIYVRALPLEAGLRPGGGFTNSSGYYTIPSLLAGTYNLYADSNQGFGIRVYRSQWYNQKDTQSQASSVSSNTSGVDFPLYKDGVFPTPVPSPTSSFAAVRVAGGDYNGDGVSDIAIFRETAGLWAVRGFTRLYFGRSGDIPVSGDYNGDGCADVALFRGSAGLWAVRGMTRNYFGGADDQPVPGDYDGDGSCDIGIFRPSTGLWAATGLGRVYFGALGDTPVSSDYDGDGLADIAVFRASSGLWAVHGVTRMYYGRPGDLPVPGDYAGGGVPGGPAVFRPSSGLWAVRGVTRAYFGSSAYQPVPADYSGNSRVQAGLCRPEWNLWAIRGLTRAYFGGPGDLPATR
ncbi:MAG: hypothetical protein V1789_05445 [PVC group bacterium]